MISLISHFILLLSTCYGQNIRPPRSTLSYVLDPQGWTPRPTSAPRYKLEARDELIRTLIWAEDKTCGYLSASESSSITCGGGTCAYLLSSSGSWGNVECCSSGPCTGSSSLFLCVNCDFPNLACVDFVNYFTYSKCNAACQIDSYTLKCTESSAPFCNTLVYSSYVVTDIRCGATDASADMEAAIGFLGETMRPDRTQFFTSDTELPSAIPSENSLLSSVATTTAKASIFGTTTSTTPDSNVIPLPTDSSVSSIGSRTTELSSMLMTTTTVPITSILANKGSGSGIPNSSVDGIIGGSVGGFFLIVLITAWIYLCWRRKRKNPDILPSLNLETSELESRHPYTTNLPVLHELHEEGAPTFAWHKLWKPTFSYQSQYSEGVPDSPTLGKHAKINLPGDFNPSFVHPTQHQELSADIQINPRQEQHSPEVNLGRETMSPLSACS